MSIATPYQYPALPAGNIRVLRLLPSEANDAPLECQLFDYPLLGRPVQSSCPYEALSYVWGSEQKPFSISILSRRSTASEPAQKLRIGANLDGALRHLRDGYAERLLWIDALCINQDDLDEKTAQVQLMANVYARASRVVVWLGDGNDTGEEALEAIRVAAMKGFGGMPILEDDLCEMTEDEGGQVPGPSQVQNANDDVESKGDVKVVSGSKVDNLLRRPWFRRVWVLQEVAAARQIIVKCGVAEIDGYAFSSGLRNMALALQVRPELYPDMMFTANLIAAAVFRSRSGKRRNDRTVYSIGAMPLAQLLDFYRTRQATKDLDKVFALLGMSQDHFPGSGSPIQVNYTLSWDAVFVDQLVKNIFTQTASVEAWCETRLFAIRAKGCVLAVVKSCKWDKNQESLLEIVAMRYLAEKPDLEDNSPSGNTRSRNWLQRHWPRRRGDLETRDWRISAPPEGILAGDMVCLLDGAQTPIIIRLCGDYWHIVMAWTPLPLGRGNQPLVPPEESLGDFLLVWDWEVKLQRTRPMPIFLGDMLSSRLTGCFETRIRHTPKDEAERILLAASVIVGVTEKTGFWGDEKSRSPLHKRMLATIELAVLKRGLGSQKLLFPLARDAGRYWRPLVFTVTKGRKGFAEWLIDTAGLDTSTINRTYQKLHCDLTPLRKAMLSGQLKMVEFLLDRNANPNQRFHDGQTPIFWAARERDLPLMEAFLKHKADINIRDSAGKTVFVREIERVASFEERNEPKPELALDVVRVLLEHGADPNEAMNNAKPDMFPNPLSMALFYGNRGLVRLLLDYGADPCYRDPKTGDNLQQWYEKGLGYWALDSVIADMVEKAQESCALHSSRQSTTSGLQEAS